MELVTHVIAFILYGVQLVDVCVPHVSSDVFAYCIICYFHCEVAWFMNHQTCLYLVLLSLFILT